MSRLRVSAGSFVAEQVESSKSGGMVAIDVRVPQNLLNRVLAIGSTLGKSRSAVAREALEIGVPHLEDEAAVVVRHRETRKESGA